MVFFKTIPRCKLFITNIPLQTIARPYSKKKGKIVDKCIVPTPSSKSGSEEKKDRGKEGIQKDGAEKGSLDKSSLRTVTSTSGKDGPPFKITMTRPVRLSPGKVRMGFIPEEWFDFFYPKTGVTGPYIFLIAVGTYLISKEKFVMEHEYYSIFSVTLLSVFAVKNVGPILAKYIDKEVDEYERLWNKQRIDERHYWEDMIQQDQRLQISCEGQLMLLQAKRENIKLQLEGVYRERLEYVYNEVKNRLDYHVAVQYIYQKLMHKNLIDWVVREVIKTYNAEKADAYIEGCINELASIAAKENKQ